ncbi:hypothetical protein FE391_20400 [Nonomuraea sp. KC401]|uniref:hypothetical protein n=1 Tax=unclassified Nonomuraea TaxID=2593643 RepID=UPI0010FDB135|nr:MULTISPECIES: hypothetical protein [unclassified Nonomuraea]NBE96181.1 hypothetical protein [Nonomuraea sp. K271]TLF71120.1 hypothetical protein FE391_20400 [Nonomuraea sp. KC401]
MDPIVLAAATALVGAMATDAWQQTRIAVVAWWRKVRSEQVETVEAELKATQIQVLAARERADPETEQALAGIWRLRLQQMLEEDPTIGPQLQRLLDEHLTPSLFSSEQSRIRQVITAHAHDQSRQFIAGRDQHITGS